MGVGATKNPNLSGGSAVARGYAFPHMQSKPALSLFGRLLIAERKNANVIHFPCNSEHFTMGRREDFELIRGPTKKGVPCHQLPIPALAISLGEALRFLRHFGL